MMDHIGYTTFITRYSKRKFGYTMCPLFYMTVLIHTGRSCRICRQTDNNFTHDCREKCPD